MLYLKKLTHVLFALFSLFLLAGVAIWLIQRTAPQPSILPAQMHEPIPTPFLDMSSTAGLSDTSLPSMSTPAPQPALTMSKIVFADSIEGIPDLYTVNPDGTELTNLTGTPHIIEARPKWAADGSKIYFLVDGSEKYISLNAINPDGNGTVKLFDWPDQVWSYDVSPDDQWVVYFGLLTT
jgi:hypothetical protein